MCITLISVWLYTAAPVLINHFIGIRLSSYGLTWSGSSKSYNYHNLIGATSILPGPLKFLSERRGKYGRNRMTSKVSNFFIKFISHFQIFKPTIHKEIEMYIPHSANFPGNRASVS